MTDLDNVFGVVKSKTGLRRSYLAIHHDVETASSRRRLSERFRGAGYSIAPTRAPSWEQKFGNQSRAGRGGRGRVCDTGAEDRPPRHADRDRAGLRSALGRLAAAGDEVAGAVKSGVGRLNDQPGTCSTAIRRAQARRRDRALYGRGKWRW